MPDASQHDQQVARNKEVYYDVLNGPKAKYDEWAMTAIFYVAVHTIDKFLAGLASGRQIDPDNHEDRFRILRAWAQRKAVELFETLFDVSVQARYQCVSFSEQQLRYYERIAFEELPKNLRSPR